MTLERAIYLERGSSRCAGPGFDGPSRGRLLWGSISCTPELPACHLQDQLSSIPNNCIITSLKSNNAHLRGSATLFLSCMGQNRSTFISMVSTDKRDVLPHPSIKPRISHVTHHSVLSGSKAKRILSNQTLDEETTSGIQYKIIMQLKQQEKFH